jgi:membrane protein
MQPASEDASQSVVAGHGLWDALKGAVSQWMTHNDAKSGAALAYYSIFSIGPLIVVVIAIAGLAFERADVQAQVISGLKGLLGDSGAQAISGMLAGAGQQGEGIFSSIIGTITLLFAAVGVVVQLKDALNAVWEVKSTPGTGLWHFARTYVFSLAGVLAIGFLMLISMLLTTALAAFGKYIGTFIPEVALQAAGFLVSFAVISLLFALMFKWLPDTEVEWQDVWIGAVGTAALFEVGKFLIALYVGKQGLESTYGAAASIVVVLIWVYYAAQIVLLGAEFTNMRSRQRWKESR